ncbi:MAG: choice-of-anchor Q domain-containing protein [Solirubrobacterales bacterium]
MRRYLTVFVTTALATTICFAASASASTRYASPDGTGSAASCLEATPCSLADATGNLSEAGDVVILKPGNYSLTSVLYIFEDIEIRGTGAPPATTITSTAPGGDAIATFSDGVELSDLKIVGQAPEGPTKGFALSMLGGTARRLIVTNNSWSACRTQNEEALFVDTVCATSATNASAFYALSANHALQHVRLSGVTAVNTNPGSGRGVSVATWEDASITLDAKSVIASGATADLESLGSTAHIELDHSNFNTVDLGNDGTTSAPGSGTNITSPPWFKDASIYDLRLDAGSPGINVGDVDAYSSATDVRGAPRVRGGTADMGAYERDLVAPDAPVIASPSNGAVLTGFPTISGTAEPGSKISMGTSQGYGVATDADESGNWSTSGMGMEPGTFTITIQSGDEDGNWSGESSVTVTYFATSEQPPPSSPDGGNPPELLPTDTTPPKLTLWVKPSAKRIEKKMTLKFSSNERGGKFLCKLDSASYKPCTSPYVKKVKLGKHTVKLVAIDKAGNRSKVTTVKFRVVRSLG